ncbi:hypothetical protein BGZ83_010398 [Gryganskiella cystojenkinii]|nr:hypothetical protein BGZ83_010398 [Gryganskiella cystojenkinii]
MRRRDANNNNPPEPDPVADDHSSATTTGASTRTTGVTTTNTSTITPRDDETSSSTITPTTTPLNKTSIDSSPNNNIVYNGRSYEGTGRLPRDAPFTPTYVNAYTVNTAIAFVSLVVTVTFFYFKIVVGILQSPQVGPEREFSTNPFMGPIDAGDPRPMLSPICHSASSSPVSSSSEEDCVLFGKIVILADSISRYGYSHAVNGWVGSLADEWAGRADVVLRSFPGYNTHWVKSIFPDLLHQESQPHSGSTFSPVKLVILALGTDDASFPHTRQHVSLEAYKANLHSLISLIRFPDSPNYSPDTQIVLVTPGPVDDVMWASSLEAIEQPVDRSNNMTKEYVQACIEVGEESHTPVVDLWTDVMCQIDGSCELHESNQLQDYLMDGLHPRRMGNEVLYKGIMNTIAHHFPNLHPTCWPSVFPGYVGGSNPEQSDLQRHCSRHRQYHFLETNDLAVCARLSNDWYSLFISLLYDSVNFRYEPTATTSERLSIVPSAKKKSRRVHQIAAKDLWKRGRNAVGYDLVPAPSVTKPRSRASRRVNDHSTAVRIIEGLKFETESEYLDQLTPSTQQLGVDTKEEWDCREWDRTKKHDNS